MTSGDIFCSAASVLLSFCDSTDLCKFAVKLDFASSCSASFYKFTTISHFNVSEAKAFQVFTQQITHH